MRKTILFLVITVAALTSLAVVSVAAFSALSTTSNAGHRSDWMGQMWGGMMGDESAATVQNPAAPYFGVAFILLVAVTAVGLSGLVYFIVLPEVRAVRPISVSGNAAGGMATVSTAQVPEVVPERPLDSVSKTLTADERRVVEVLRAHNGEYLQKYIRKEAALSRLQTHRIVARLAERGIVTLEKTGNTNTVRLANWLN